MRTDWQQSMKRSLMRIIAFVVGVLSLASPTSVAGQTDVVPYCTADMLDIRVLPPLQAKSGLEIHALVVELQNRELQNRELQNRELQDHEIQNREKLSCALPQAPHIELIEQGGADELVANDFEDDASTAEEFQKKQYILAPGEVVHALIVWPSRASWDSFAGCFNRDRMALAFDYNQPPPKCNICGRVCVTAPMSPDFVWDITPAIPYPQPGSSGSRRNPPILPYPE